MAPTQARQWQLAHKPSGYATLEGPNPTFKQTTGDLPSQLEEGSILIKVLYLSNDPAQRGWISAAIESDRLYVPPVEVGDTMRARGLGEIIDTNLTGEAAAKFKKGGLVLGTCGWTDYAVLPAAQCIPVGPLPNGISNTHYLGALGTTGMTAWYGLMEIAKATKDDIVVVSGAAGATGSMVVQIAKKMVGCKKVIGIAGGDAKCKWVKEEMGADECVDYKSESFKEDLKKATGEYANVYFDNVGGEILDLMLTRMAKDGRVAACGAISAYNTEDDPNQRGLQNWFQVITQRIHIQGFIVLDFYGQQGKPQEVTQKFLAALKEGKLKVTEDMETVVDTKFEDIPHTWNSLFEGKNQGKLVTKLI